MDFLKGGERTQNAVLQPRKTVSGPTNFARKICVRSPDWRIFEGSINIKKIQTIN